MKTLQNEVLDNLEDGVLVLGAGGRIAAINPSAKRILDLPDVSGQSFTEALIMQEGLDDFSQMLVEATQKKGEQRHTVQIRADTDNERTLTVATSYIRNEGKIVSVVAVFSDITEINALREAEQAQHNKLQGAYREIEERNTELAIALRKIRIGQILGALFALALFTAAGLWSSRSLVSFEPTTEHVRVDERTTNRHQVREHPVSTSVTLRGALAPWKMVAVRAQVNGRLINLRVTPGQYVDKGALLAEIDLELAQSAHVERRSSHLAAVNELDTVENWSSSEDMTNAKRNMTKSKLNWEGVQTTIKKNRFLYGEGLLSDEDMARAEREYTSQRLDFEASEDAFRAVENRNTEQMIDNARLTAQAAEKALKRAEQALSQGRVYAPIAGTVLKPKGEIPTAGYEFRSGEVIVRVGDFSRIAIDVEADESDITKFSEGQSVEVTGNAFRAMNLSGLLTYVASQANHGSRGIPKFQVRATLDPIETKDAEGLRIGMSAQMRIITYYNPTAILVPIRAVDSRGDKYTVRVVKPDGETEQRNVEIGPTTFDSIEITQGLKSGEIIESRADQ